MKMPAAERPGQRKLGTARESALTLDKTTCWRRLTVPNQIENSPGECHGTNAIASDQIIAVSHHCALRRHHSPGGECSPSVSADSGLQDPQRRAAQHSRTGRDCEAHSFEC